MINILALAARLLYRRKNPVKDKKALIKPPYEIATLTDQSSRGNSQAATSRANNREAAVITNFFARNLFSGECWDVVRDPFPLFSFLIR